MVRLGQLLDSVPWFDLIPSGLATRKNPITQGGGTYGEADYIASAATVDGKTLLAYMPPTSGPSREVTIDMALLASPAHACWFDPSSGKFTATSKQPLLARGSVSFETPGKNASGATDWVLVLQVGPNQTGTASSK